MDLKHRIGVIAAWVFAGLALVGSIYLMFWIGSLNLQTNINEVELDAEAQSKAIELSNIFTEFEYKSTANPVVIDDTVTDNEPIEAAYGEIIYEQQGILTNEFAKFDKFIKLKNYTVFGDENSIYYNSFFEEDVSYLKTKYTLDEDALVVEYYFDQSEVCSADNRCFYLPDKGSNTQKSFSNVSNLNITKTKVIYLDNSSYIASLEEQEAQ